MNSSEVFLNKYKTFPIRFFFITEIVLVENRILFFKSDTQIVAKIRLTKNFKDLKTAIEENNIMVRPQ